MGKDTGDWCWDVWRGRCCPCRLSKKVIIDDSESDFINASLRVNPKEGDEETKEEYVKEVNNIISRQRTLKKKGTVTADELKNELSGDNRKYIEVKFPQFSESPISRNCWRFYSFLTDNTFVWTVFVIAISLVIAIWGEEHTDSFRDGLKTFNVGFAAVFSVLISLLFSNGVEKNKTNKKLFQALCGDIKALAFFISALTDDEDKYNIAYDPDKVDPSKNDPKKGETYVKGVATKEKVEVELAKIRYLLCVLAPVAKHVLRQAPKHHMDAANYDMLDDKYRIKLIIPTKVRCCIIKWSCCGITCRKNKKNRPKTCFNGIYSSFFGIPLCCAKCNRVFPFEDDNSQAWSNLGGKNPIKRYLYRKIKYISDKSDMDLFEVIMYCLLDQLNTLREYKYGIPTRKEGGYSKERDLIAKWQHIYSSWGTMYSLTTYKQPVPVHTILTVSLTLYTVSLAMYYKSTALFNYGPGGDWFGEQPTTEWIRFFVFMQSVLTILPFTVLWSLAKTIGRPFKRGATDSNIVTKDAKDTQAQVSKLLQYRPCIDKLEILQYGVNMEEELKAAKDRGSILLFDVDDNKTCQFDIDKGSKKARRPSQIIDKQVQQYLKQRKVEEESKQNENRKSEVVGAEKNNSVRKRLLKFKNVNF